MRSCCSSVSVLGGSFGGGSLAPESRVQGGKTPFLSTQLPFEQPLHVGRQITAQLQILLLGSGLGGATWGVLG